MIEREFTEMLIRLAFLLVVISGCFYGQSAEKPRCTAKTRGMVWPPQRARDSCAEVEVCSFHVWKYRWEPVTVNVSQLARDKKRRTACKSAESTPAQSLEDNDSSTARK